MEDRDFFEVYSEENISLDGYISEGSLRLKSEVYGKGYSSEKNYVFSVEDTNKLFSIISFEDFIESCQKGHLEWMEGFLKENGIELGTFTF